MSASTVTGKGPGSSFGKYKPENNCGGCHCGCGKKDCEHHREEEPKIGCYTTVKVGNAISYVATGGIPTCQVCS